MVPAIWLDQIAGEAFAVSMGWMAATPLIGEVNVTSKQEDSVNFIPAMVAAVEETA